MYSITLLRVFCVLQVFFLHYFARIGLKNYIWIFQIAVPVFLLVSAYLYGQKIRENEKLTFTFLLKRYKVLSVVYYPFIVGVFIFYSITDFENFYSYLKSAFFELLYLTNFSTPLPNCGHLWFMQLLIFSYIALFIATNIPFVRKIFINDVLSSIMLLIIILCGFIYRGGELIYIFFYLWTFFNAKRISEWNKKDNLIYLFLILILGYIMLSLQYRNLFKMGIYYEYIQVSIMAIITIMIFIKIFNKNHKSNVILLFSTISMEFYLLHHLFVFDFPIYISFPITIILSVFLLQISKSIKQIFKIV